CFRGPDRVPLSRDPSACFQEIFPVGELHARSPERLAGRLLRLVDRLPALVGDERRALRVELFGQITLGGCRELPGAGVLEQQLDRLRGVLLVGADDAARAALDPPGDIRTTGTGHAAALVRDRPRLLVERDARAGDALVADARQHDPRRDDLQLTGRAGDETALFLDELVADDLDRLDLAVAEDRDRRDEEAKHNASGLPLQRLRGVLL